MFLGKQVKESYKSENREFGLTLEMPDNYASYVDLRSEFEKILDSKIWVMDIV